MFCYSEFCSYTTSVIRFKECDLGQQSILHAVKARTRLPSTSKMRTSIIEEALEEQEPAKPLSQTLVDLQLDPQERINISENGE